MESGEMPGEGSSAAAEVLKDSNELANGNGANGGSSRPLSSSAPSSLKQGMVEMGSDGVIPGSHSANGKPMVEVDAKGPQLESPASSRPTRASARHGKRKDLDSQDKVSANDRQDGDGATVGENCLPKDVDGAAASDGLAGKSSRPSKRTRFDAKDGLSEAKEDTEDIAKDEALSSTSKTPTTPAPKTKASKRKKTSDDSDEEYREEQKRPAKKAAPHTASKTTGFGRLAKAGQAVGTAQRKSVFLDKEHVVEKGLVDWFNPLLVRMLRLWIQWHCNKQGLTFSEDMLAECAFHALSRQKYPLKFVSGTLGKESGVPADTLLRTLAYLILSKCLPFTSTYVTFYAENDASMPNDETPGVNCEAGWKPLYRPVRTFVLDVFPFAAKGTGEPTISTMCNDLDYWSMTDEQDREAWEVCCQLQVCNVAFVTTLGLQMAFTDEYPKEARIKAIIHAVRCHRLIRDREKLRNVKHMHVAKRLIMDRCVSRDWLLNPHLPPHIRERLADPYAICIEIKGSKKKSVDEDEEAVKLAIADLDKTHQEMFGTSQKSFSAFDWKPRTKGDTVKDVFSSDDEGRSGKRSRRNGKGHRGDGELEGEYELSASGSEADLDAEASDADDDVNGGEEALPSWVIKSLRKQSKKAAHARIIDSDAIVAEWEREDEEDYVKAMEDKVGVENVRPEVAAVMKNLTELVDF
ncbi:hypothetical protein HDU67_006507 [Dinochytrium kinnereticum]|nr:hypothetical protein HDU67_006507 [Dinochytrium kinnereticum]